MGPTYQKASGSAGSKGIDFQINLISIFLLNALHNFKDWKLSTENKLAGKFDDVVFELSDGSAILLQAKHKQHKKVTLNQLLSTKNEDFSLPKYFSSYLDIRTKFEVKNIIICTNTQAESKIFEFLNRNNDVGKENLLFYEDGTCFYSFNNDILSNLVAMTRIYFENNSNQDVDETSITEENAREFLKHLQFYLEYPSGNDLEKVIEKLLSNLKCFGSLLNNISHRDLHREIRNWFELPHSEYLTESRAKMMFAELQSEKYCEFMEEQKIFFKSNDLGMIRESKKRIFHVVAEEGPFMHVMMVFRSLQDMKNKILCAEKDVQGEVVKAFQQLHFYTHLIIVSPEFSEVGSPDEIWGILKNTLQSREYKKIIFVAEYDNKLAKAMKNLDKDYFVLHKTLNLTDLLEDTQEKLINKKIVRFQGTDVSIEELFSDQMTDDYKKSIKENILEKLVKNEKVIVGTDLDGLQEDISSCYMDRMFRRMTGEVRERENKKIKKRNKQTFSEKNIYNVLEKIILISNGAGTGKSTVLANLAVKIKKQKPLLWVVRIELNHRSGFLKDCLKNNKIDLWDLLSCKDTSRSTNELEAIIYSLEGKVVLMLDGVDEVSPDYTNLILDILVQGQKAKNISKIFVTTRPHMAKELETHLNVTSFGLVPLTELNQIDLLTNYWTYNLKLQESEKQQCKRYAKTLINKVSSWIMASWYTENDSPLIACPLQAKMLAEVFLENQGKEPWEGCKEYLSGNDIEPKLPEKMNIARLYEMFVDHKKSIFVQKGNPSGNTTANQALMDQFEEYLAYHKSLAIQTILNEEQRELFSCYRQDVRDKETIVLKMGIVQKVGNKLCFVHRTFAEYFVAESVFEEIRLKKSDVKFENFLINELFLNAEFDVVRHFFNSFLQKFLHSEPSQCLLDSFHFSSEKNFHSKSPLTLSMRRVFSRTFCSSSIETRLLKRQNSYTAIHKLAMGGNTEIIRLILNCISLKNIEDSNQPHQTCSSSKTTTNSLKYLVKRDVVNLKDDKGGTPLHHAVIGGHLDTVQLLVALGADLKAGNQFGGTALHLAFKFNKWEIAKFLLSIGVDINITDNVGRSPLHLAVIGGKRNTVEYLVKEGADVNMRDKRGRTALFFVDSRSVTEYLLDCGAKVNIRDQRKCTALHLAALKGGRSIPQILVKRGVDIGAKDGKGRTALHFAVLGFVWSAFKYLLEQGMDVNVADKKGLTVLHLAAQRGSFSIVEFLVNRGADVKMVDRKGRTALDFAVARYHRDVTEFFREYCPEMHVVTEEGWPLIIEFFKKHK